MADAGLLTAEYFSWYASAALPLHNKYHKKNPEEKLLTHKTENCPKWQH